MLYWLAAEYYSGSGVVVDAGAHDYFLRTSKRFVYDPRGLSRCPRVI